MSRVVEWTLRVWAGWLVLSAALWIAVRGLGLGWGVLNLLPWPLTIVGPNAGLRRGLTFGAYFTDTAVGDRFYDLGEELTRVEQYNARNATAQPLGLSEQTLADVSVGWGFQITGPTAEQELVFITLNVLTLLVTAWLWWSLADVVRRGRAGRAFTPATARRLSLAGGVVLVGAPSLALCTWALNRWAAGTSQLAGQLTFPAFGPLDLPWVAMAAGAALMILGSVWRRAVVLEREVAGLV